MSAATTFLLGTVLLAASGAEDAGALETRLLEAQRLYDETAARSLIDKQWASVGVDTTDEERALFVRGLLLLCELLRIDFEGMSKQDYKEKRALGHQIDSHARKGLEQTELLEESATKYRLRADLYATMIRTDFQAKKHRKKMETATAKALDLDPNDSRAHVAAAKPLLFAGPNRGGDPKAAIVHLDRALEIEPALERALLLRGLASERLGNIEQAEADWRQALENNPDCRPAADKLERLAASG